VGQRRLGIGVDRNVRLDKDSAAGSGGIAGGLESAFERELAGLDRIAPKVRVFPGAAVLRVPEIRSADELQCERGPKPLGWKMLSKIGDRKC
jgi:hypothetical protein